VSLSAPEDRPLSNLHCGDEGPGTELPRQVTESKKISCGAPRVVVAQAQQQSGRTPLCRRLNTIAVLRLSNYLLTIYLECHQNDSKRRPVYLFYCTPSLENPTSRRQLINLSVDSYSRHPFHPHHISPRENLACRLLKLIIAVHTVMYERSRVSSAFSRRLLWSISSLIPPLTVHYGRSSPG
jgi:hypothetical protein